MKFKVIEIFKIQVVFMFTLAISACGNSNNIELAEHLKICKPLEQKISYVIFGEEYARSIKGLVGDNCHYIEQAPGNAQIECFYPEAKRQQIADFYLYPDKFDGDSIKTNQKTTFVNGNPVTRTVYIVDGIETFHPLQDSYENGECRTTVNSKK